MKPDPFPLSTKRPSCLINGVLFTREQRDKIYTNQISFDEIMQFKNIEKRRAAIQYIGMNALLIKSDFHLIDESERGNQLYGSTRLYLDAQRCPQWLFFLSCHCPSTWRPYVSAVDATDILCRLDKETYDRVRTVLISSARNRHIPKLHGVLADSAMAWKLSLTLDEYRSITAEA